MLPGSSLAFNSLRMPPWTNQPPQSQLPGHAKSQIDPYRHEGVQVMVEELFSSKEAY